MTTTDVMKLHGTEREVKLGESSVLHMFSGDIAMARVTIQPTREAQEGIEGYSAFYCIKGHGSLKGAHGENEKIKPGIFYSLKEGERHWLKASDTIILIAVGNVKHRKDKTK
jgi:quercetin dioxygenase-like cupin family protein